MQTIFVSGHFDGERILLDEPFAMEPNTKLLIAVLPDTDDERNAWLRASAERLMATMSPNMRYGHEGGLVRS